MHIDFGMKRSYFICEIKTQKCLSLSDCCGSS